MKYVNRNLSQQNYYSEMKKIILLLAIGLFCMTSWAVEVEPNPTIVTFSNGALTLRGELFLPQGNGPFPVVLYNHGSAPKMQNSVASAAIGLEFVKHGWAFFMPYRRGQGLSEEQGSYIMDEVNSARLLSWDAAVEKMVELQKTDHLSDQMAALSWLKKQDFIQSQRIATMGNSFGGIQVVLGVEKGAYCAGVNASGAAQSWNDSLALQNIMKKAVANANSPIFFFQAQNDYDLAPSKVLSSHMNKSGKESEIKIYPAFGSSPKEGHRLPWAGVSVWFNDALTFIDKHCALP